MSHQDGFLYMLWVLLTLLQRSWLGNTNYRKAPKFAAGPTGGKKKKYDGMSAVEKVRADIEKKYGKGAIMDTKKKKDKKEDKK